MNSITKRRLLTAVMILVLAVAFWLACAGMVNAAKKSFYVPIKATSVNAYQDGTSSSVTIDYKYFKNGLRKSIKYNDGDYSWKEVFKRNKNGYVTSRKDYDADGEWDGYYEVKFKKGYPSTAKYYTVYNGNKTLKTKYTFTYKKGKLVKEVVKTDNGDEGKTTTTITYWSNGNTKKAKSDNYTDTYDKHGNLTKSVYNSKYTSGTHTYKNTYKKGRLTKVVETMSIFDKEDQETSTSTTVTTYKYKTNKAGAVTEVVEARTWTGGGVTTTTKYKLKKFKVDKKFWKFFD